MSLFDTFNDTVGHVARTVAGPFRNSLDETIGAITSRTQKDRQPPEVLEQRGLLTVEGLQVFEMAEVVDACHAVGRPELAAGFLKAGTSLTEVKQRLADATPPADVVSARANAAAFIIACDTAGVGYLADVLIRENASMDQARARIEAAEEMHLMFKLGAKLRPADVDAEAAKGYVLAGSSIEHARTQMFSAMVAGEEKNPTDNKLAIGAPAAGNGWDRVIERVNQGR